MIGFRLCIAYITRVRLHHNCTYALALKCQIQ